MKKNSLIIFLFTFMNIISNPIWCQEVIKVNMTNGSYKLTCKVNGIPMLFLFDTGASDVSISITEANFLIKQGLLNDEDFIGTEKYGIANGDIIVGTKILLRKIEVEGILLRNIEATIIHNSNASLLFGMSAINKIGKVVISNNTLFIYPNQEEYSRNSTNDNKANRNFAYNFPTIKIDNLEIMKEDLTFILKMEDDYMDWEEAKQECENLGNGWRLPTITELKILYKNQDIIGGFNRSNWDIYWSSEITQDRKYVWRFDFEKAKAVFDAKYNFANVRAVRNLK